MTPEEIEKLEAGRELDVLIAEKVMCWINFHEIVIGGQHKWCGSSSQWDGLGELVPQYSSEIAAAWQVVEKLKELSATNIVIEMLQYSEEWWCEVRGISNSKGESLQSAKDKTAPLVICKAALKALMK